MMAAMMMRTIKPMTEMPTAVCNVSEFGFVVMINSMIFLIL